MSTVLMYAPAGRTGTVYSSQTGSSYLIGADGAVTVDQRDVVDLIRAGFASALRTSNAASGLSVTRLELIEFKNVDGTTLSASASSGKFGLAQTLGTSENLAGETAQNNTKTDAAMTTFVLPPNYVAGQDVTVTVNAKLAGSGTPGTKTIAVAAYESSQAGVDGANLVATAAAALSTSNADYPFVISGAALVPGDEVQISVTAVIQETGNSTTINAQINSVRYG